MSAYTAKKCLDRAENCRAWDDGQAIREHTKVAEASSDPDEARLARGFAFILAQRRMDDLWRSMQYERLARGEDITR